MAILYLSEYNLSFCLRDKTGRLLCALFACDGLDFQLCNIYGPNRAKDGDLYIESLYAILDADLPIILCGDFNTVVDPYKDHRGCNPVSVWAYNWTRTLLHLTSAFNLQDVWRSNHPHASEFTWHRSNHNQTSLLDMFWLSACILPLLLSSLNCHVPSPEVLAYGSSTCVV